MPNTEEKPVTKSEVETIVQSIVNNAVDGLATSINTAFTDQQKQIFRLEEKLEEKMDEGFAGMNQRIDAVNSRIDDAVNNYTRRDEHKKLEKRVVKLETAIA